jgi:hypothetical protein
MFCSPESHSLKKNHEPIASARSIRGFFARRRVTLGKPAHQNAYQLFLKAGDTVLDDGESDTMFGVNGHDWYFAPRHRQSDRAEESD